VTGTLENMEKIKSDLGTESGSGTKTERSPVQTCFLSFDLPSLLHVKWDTVALKE
jgi:hypothetical protein